jgi:hypothetical protein
MLGTFEELGRKREDYAIKLRKKKKDDLIREKRMKAHDDNESPTKKSQEREKVLGSINTALVDPNTPLVITPTIFCSFKLTSTTFLKKQKNGNLFV